MTGSEDLDADARALRDEAKLLTESTREKIDAYRKQARRLTWVVVAVGALMLAVGVVGVYGARISAHNNQLLHESEYAFCAAGLPPPTIANTQACKLAERKQAAKSASQVGPFADIVCEKVVRALGGKASGCGSVPTPTKTLTRVVPGPTRTVTVTRCVRPSGRPC